MTTTTRYALPLLQAGQAQKEVTHNDALARIDAVLQLAVDSRSVVAAPDANGAWVVPASGTGAWSGHDGEVAIHDDAGWSFVAPCDGCIAYVRDEAIFVHRRDGAWRGDWPIASVSFAGGAGSVAGPTGGTVIDAETRAAFGTLLAILRRAGIVAT